MKLRVARKVCRRVTLLGGTGGYRRSTYRAAMDLWWSRRFRRRGEVSEGAW